MLYLFGSGSWKNDRRVLKVGYTDDIETRKQQYRLHNPLGEFIDFRDGDEIEETKLHLRLIDYKVEFLEEWFYSEDDVINIFKDPWSEIDKWIWEHINEVLLTPTFPQQGTIKYKILDELRGKFGNIVLGEKNF